MNFSWTASQQDLFQKTLEFAGALDTSELVNDDRDSNFPRRSWNQLVDHGVLGWALPRNMGGAEYDPLLCSYLMEALGQGFEDNGLLFALGTQMWGVQSCLNQFGNEEQQNHYLGAILSGEKIGAYAINEPESGSDAFNLSTVAHKTGDDYVISGKKTLISMSGVADFAIVFALTNPDAGRWGLSAFIVDTNLCGINSQPNESMMGLKTVPFGGITLNECRVPKACLIGAEGAGAAIFNFSQCWERSLILAPQIGTMSRLLDLCTEYSKTNLRGQIPIGKNQAISHRVADMKIRLETSRLLLYRTAWLLAEGKQNLMEAAMTKVHLSEAFVDSARDAIAIHGGNGYLCEYQIERQLRDAIGGTIHGGTVDLQRNIIAGLLGL